MKRSRDRRAVRRHGRLRASAAAQDAPFPIAAWSRTTAAVETAARRVERGAAVFNNWCSACHSRGPQNAPGTTSLQNKYQGSVPAALEDRRTSRPRSSSSSSATASR